MKLAEVLIDKAAKKCGGYSALARHMGIYPTDVSKLKGGQRPLSPEIAAELADIAGEDAREAAITAIIERTAGTEKGNRLREILGKVLAVGGVAVLLFSYSGDSISNTQSLTKTNTNLPITHIVLSRLIQLLRQLTEPARATAHLFFRARRLTA